jgi:hypothetical protein
MCRLHADYGNPAGKGDLGLGEGTELLFVEALLPKLKIKDSA